MLDRQLHRQRLVLYFSRQIDESPSVIASTAGQRTHYEAVLQQMTTEFEQLQQLLANVFPSARITPMKDADHYRHCTTFLNPSLAERFDYDPIETFDPGELLAQRGAGFG